MHAHTHTRTHMHAREHTHARTHAHTHARAHTHTCTLSHAHTRKRMHTRTHAHTRHTRTHTRTHARTHTHTHTHTRTWATRLGVMLALAEDEHGVPRWGGGRSRRRRRHERRGPGEAQIQGTGPSQRRLVGPRAGPAPSCKAPPAQRGPPACRAQRRLHKAAQGDITCGATALKGGRIDGAERRQNRRR